MIKKNYLVIGLGRFGATVAKNLAKMNYEVVAIDKSEDAVKSISNDVRHCFIADGTKESVLEELGVKNIDHAIVAIGQNLQASILTAVNLRKLGVKKITVRADEANHREVFELLGADEVIIPEESSAISFSNQILSDTVLDYYEIASDHVMVKLIVNEEFEAKSLIDLDIRNKYDVNVVGIIKNDIFFVPKGTDLIEANDIAVVVGRKDQIKKITKLLSE